MKAATAFLSSLMFQLRPAAVLASFLSMCVALLILLLLPCPVSTDRAWPMFRPDELCREHIESLGLPDKMNDYRHSLHVSTSTNSTDNYSSSIIPNFLFFGDSTMKNKVEYMKFLGFGDFVYFYRLHTASSWASSIPIEEWRNLTTWADVIVWNQGMHMLQLLPARRADGDVSSLQQFEEVLNNSTDDLFDVLRQIDDSSNSSISGSNGRHRSSSTSSDSSIDSIGSNLIMISSNVSNKDRNVFTIGGKRILIYYKLSNSVCQDKYYGSYIPASASWMNDPKRTMRKQYETQFTEIGSTFLNYAEKKLMRRLGVPVLNSMSAGACACTKDGRHYQPLAAHFWTLLLQRAISDSNFLSNNSHSRFKYISYNDSSNFNSNSSNSSSSSNNNVDRKHIAYAK